jgi:outer membrane protein assembly factor BamB
MVKTFTILLCLIAFNILLPGCREKDLERNSDGSISTKKYLWGAPVNSGSYMATGLRTSVTYEGDILAPYATGIQYLSSYTDRGGIVRLDGETGKDKWRWAGYMFWRELFDINFVYLRNNYLVIPSGPRTHCVDMNTGKTVWQKWKQDTVYTNVRISGIGDSYFYAGRREYEDSSGHMALYKGNVLRPDPEELVVNPQLPREFFGRTPIPSGAAVTKPVVIKGDTMLIVDYQRPTAQAAYNYIRSVYGLYNLSKKVWVYKDVPLIEPHPGSVVDHMPVIYENKVYHAVGRYITCHNLLTGERVWDRPFAQDFLSSGFIVAEGLVVANCEDTYIYGHNSGSGAEVWREKSSGTSTKLLYQDGYVYYAGGGDGLLHAVEVKTGKTEWRLRSPDLAKNSGAYFWGMVSAIPAKNGKKGRIFASTGLHIYAFEAIR